MRLKRQISYLLNYFSLVPIMPLNGDWTIVSQQSSPIVGKDAFPVMETPPDSSPDESDSFEEMLLDDPASVSLGMSLFPDSFN